jgi:hypothetical protein
MKHDHPGITYLMRITVLRVLLFMPCSPCMRLHCKNIPNASRFLTLLLKIFKSHALVAPQLQSCQTTPNPSETEGQNIYTVLPAL